MLTALSLSVAASGTVLGRKARTDLFVFMLTRPKSLSKIRTKLAFISQRQTLHLILRISFQIKYLSGNLELQRQLDALK